MNKIKTIISTVFILFLVAISNEAFAAGASDAQASISSIGDLVTNPSIATKQILTAVFGDVVFGGQTSTVLTKAIGFFNIPAMIVGVIVVVYFMFAGALNTAATGEVLGKSFSSVWMPIRISTAFGLIIPQSSFGGGVLSVVQWMMLKLIILSSGLAGMFLNNLYPEIFSYKAPINGYLAPPPISQAQGLMGSAVCAVNDWLAKGGDTGSKIKLYSIVSMSRSGPISKTVYAGGEASDGIQSSPYSFDGDYISSIAFGPSGVCGSIELSGISPDRNRPEVNAAYAAVSKVIIEDLNFYTEVEKLARSSHVVDQMIDMVLNSNVSNREEVERFQKVIDNINSLIKGRIGSYQGRMTSAVLQAFQNNTDAAKNMKDIIGDLNDWFWVPINHIKIVAFEGAPSGVMSTISGKLNNSSWNVCLDGAEGCPQNHSTFLDAVRGNNYKFSSTMKLMQLATRAINDGEITETAPDGRSQRVACATETCSQTKFVDDIGFKAMDLVLNNLSSAGGYSAKDSNGLNLTPSSSLVDFGAQNDPFTRGAEIGFGLLSIITAGWGAGLVATVLSAGAAASPLSIFGAGLQAGLTYVMNTTWTPISMCLGLSLILAILGPLQLTIRWYFAIINWILSCVELLSAAPVGFIQMAVPDQASGMGSRMERVNILIVMAVCTPSLLVLSYMAILSIGSVAYNLLVFMLLSVSVVSDSVWVSLAVVFISVLMIYYLCTTLVGFVDVLPRAFGEWFGGRQNTYFNNGIDQKAEQAMKTMAGAAQSGIGAAHKENIESRRARRNSAPTQKPDTDNSKPSI